MNLTPEQRVANGAAWLDEDRPGWESKIDLARLDIASGIDCICGQVFADLASSDHWMSGYFAVVGRLPPLLAAAWVEQRGFYDSDPETRYQLRHFWTLLIKERFSSGLLSDQR
jgi:hypothetical protein